MRMAPADVSAMRLNGRRVARIGTQAPDEPRVLAVTWLPLSRAALCINEHEAIFDVSEGRCPACASENFVLLGKWLAGRRER